ncbi:MAG: phosphate ABC transporter permease PstA [Anaerorhabdus sp.]
MRKSDYFLNAMTYLASFISVFVLVSLLWFLFSKGASSLSLDLLKNPYWSQNYLGSVSEKQETYPLTQEVDGFYSEEWGVAFQDVITTQKKQVIEVVYIHPNSPLQSMVSLSANNQGEELIFEVGDQVEKIDYMDVSGQTKMTGSILSQSAEEVVMSLQQATTIESIYFKTEGGGIFGSLITTLYLIAISLVIALPLGVGSAIYLHEYAKQNKLNRWLRYGIETLTGVPSIVYGLMGVSVLFPVTQIVGATTVSILLGGLTMSIILLPVIMKSTEEALIVVPQSLRDGSYSLGATQFQTIFKVVLPCALNGILTGVLLSVGRVIGESAALVYTMGTFINDSPTLISQGTSLSLMIWSFMSQEQPSFELACAISIIILMIVFLINIVVKLIGKKFAKKFV